MTLTIEKLARIRKLVDLAAHVDTPDQEARTAAITACQLIVATGFLAHYDTLARYHREASAIFKRLEARGIVRTEKR